MCPEKVKTKTTTKKPYWKQPAPQKEHLGRKRKDISFLKAQSDWNSCCRFPDYSFLLFLIQVLMLCIFFVWLFFFSPAQSTIFFLLAWNYFCFLTVSCLESCFLFYPLFCFVLFWQATGVCLYSWLAGSWAPVLLVALAPDAVSLWKTYLSVAELEYCLVDPTSDKVACNSHPDLYMKQVQEDGKLSGIGKKGSDRDWASLCLIALRWSWGLDAQQCHLRPEPCGPHCPQGKVVEAKKKVHFSSGKMEKQSEGAEDCNCSPGVYAGQLELRAGGIHLLAGEGKDRALLGYLVDAAWSALKGKINCSSLLFEKYRSALRLYWGKYVGESVPCDLVPCVHAGSGVCGHSVVVELGLLPAVHMWWVYSRRDRAEKKAFWMPPLTHVC